MYEKSADSTCTFQRQRLIFQSYFENNFDHIYTHADKYLYYCHLENRRIARIARTI
jgi:hypothetical protein